ncbi:MAG: FAD-dependent oxidoreductase [Rhodospirillaceae bacterium]|nr:FAD-dependent oxidoreductase [Rhodospirillaceae bacterium]
MGESEFDVIVVGCGIAGLSAAVTAEQHGARVAVLERAPMEERGGNTRYTESFWRMKSADAVSDDFEERFAANAGGWPDPGIVKDAVLERENQPRVLRSLGMVDPNLVATLAEEAPKALQWLQSFGVTFDFLPTYFLSQSTTRMGPVGGGLALIEALGGYADARPGAIRFFYETSARSLIVDDAGSVAGIRAMGPDNAPFDLFAPNVILASGGFQGNPEMLSRYVGPLSQFIRPVSRGGHYNRGEGVAMALDAGAAPCGDFGSFHAQPVDPRSTDIEPVVLTYAYGILVNDAGKRFTDEGPAMVDSTYEVVTRIIMGQRNGIAFAVFDAGLDDVENWSIAVRSRVPPFEADTLEGLAAAMDIDSDEFLATIEAYNAACPASGDFQPLRQDGLATRGVEPKKSNWARPIIKPPFRAWPMICSNCFTFGGVKVDERARVINTDGDPIPGLYAAGEVVGLYYRVYTGATSVMRGAVTGRLAGRDAAG